MLYSLLITRDELSCIRERLASNIATEYSLITGSTQKKIIVTYFS
jgi:hypothetical protein